ncbi:MAG TPA: hypothetical protein VKZ84_05170 [Bacteriovoracaceae bacterium]|nr:hypothetical protein [Bacteriovoracaceae bacterium]
MTTKFRPLALATLSALGINTAQALPIDWSGTFGVDSHYLSNMRMTSDKVTTAQDGSQAIEGSKNGTNFQSYIFKLNPTIIINDGVTLKGEISTGSIRGGFAGDEGGNENNGSYFFTSPSQNSTLNLNQLYAELYADTALIKIGRMSKHYGLGVIYDNGTDAWDRFFTMYDGIEAEMKIGNFSLIPYWAKISSLNDKRNSDPSGKHDVREIGAIAKYHNKNSDLLVSILYAKRSSEPDNTFYQRNDQTTTPPPSTEIGRGKTEVTIIDPYIEKKWGKLKVAFEAPIITGDYGNVLGAVGTGNSKIAANAYILDAQYDINPKWEVGLKAGQISGDKAGTNKFEAAYLHPNFQIAELMFRYYYPGFSNNSNDSRSIFNSPITNAQFARLHGTYKTDKWNWKAAFIFANAMETAQAGKDSYNHQRNYAFRSDYKQDKSLGYEIDFGFDYMWNPNVVVSGYYGYWFVGDYFAFNNTNKEQSLSNVHGGGLRVTVGF